MPRTARIDFTGLLHHVMARGIARGLLFVDDRDRAEFVDRLSRVLPECGIDCFAWALMPNHFHLVVRTSDEPLARAMARLLTGYAGYFNRCHDRVGHLFQNRYHSIPVHDERYLLALVRYVHRNPLSAGLVRGIAELGDHPWTGHAVLMGHRTATFQQTEEVLARFGPDRGRARSRLERWMTGDDDGNPGHALRGEVSVATLLAKVCRALELDPASLRSRARRRSIRDARAVVAYLGREVLGHGPVVLGEALGLTRGAIWKAARRGTCLVASNPGLARVEAELRRGIVRPE